MAGQLTPEELGIVGRLRMSGNEPALSTLMVVMATRSHARPRQELLHVLRQYQGLEDPFETDLALQRLIDSGDVVCGRLDGREILSAADDLAERIASRLGDVEVRNTLRRLGSHDTNHVIVLGDVESPGVYGTYEDALRGASASIRWPMIASSPNLGSVVVLKERARAGVSVRILMATPDATARLRGQAMRQTSKDAIRGWAAHARDVDNLDVRVTSNVNDLMFPSSTLIDHSLLRLNIHDPHRQRSLDGVMLRVTGRQDFEPNLITVFAEHFDSAWRRARPVEGMRLSWLVLTYWRWLATVGFAGLAGVFGAAWGAVPAAVFSSASASFLVDALITHKPLWGAQRRRAQW